MFHIDLHTLRIDGDVAADRGDQIISQRIKLGWSQIRAVMDEDELQALFGAIRTFCLSEESIKKTHIYFLPANR
jgi:hypothetical protein